MDSKTLEQYFALKLEAEWGPHDLKKRQDAKDRMRSQNDYRVNLKAELEIRQLHEKVDHLISRQWQRLAEIQQLQIDLMEEMNRRQRP